VVFAPRTEKQKEFNGRVLAKEIIGAKSGGEGALLNLQGIHFVELLNILNHTGSAILYSYIHYPENYPLKIVIICHQDFEGKSNRSYGREFCFYLVYTEVQLNSTKIQDKNRDKELKKGRSQWSNYCNTTIIAVISSTTCPIMCFVQRSQLSRARISQHSWVLSGGGGFGLI